MNGEETRARILIRNKKLIVLCACFILFVIAFIFILVPQKGIDPSKVRKISIQDSWGNLSYISERAEIEKYISAVNSAKNVEEQVTEGGLSQYELRLQIENGKEDLILKLLVNKSLDKKEAWLKGEEGGVKKLNEGLFNSIMVNQIFDSLYPNNRPPEASLVLNGSPAAILPAFYDWNIKKADDNFYPSKTDYLKGNDVYSLQFDESSRVGFDFEVNPDSLRMDIYKDGVSVYSTSGFQANQVNLMTDGAYEGVLEAEWNKHGNRDFYGRAVYEFEITAVYNPTFEISANEIYPGELLVIKANNVNDNQTVDIRTDIDFKPAVFKAGSTRMILLPVSFYHQADKSYNINLASGGVEQSFKVFLKDKEFITQYMTIDPKIAAETRNDKSAQEVQEKVNPLKPVSDEQKYWEGLFLQPVEGGRVSPQDFGKRRYVNKAPTSYRHNGLDIGQDAGTPIMASNTGRVILAEYLIGTGYTVIIEHGFGLKTWYYHMNELKTGKGAMVRKGDIIGLVGSTGFSTSPHLHFSASINNIWINPMTLIEEGIPLFGDNED